MASSTLGLPGCLFSCLGNGDANGIRLHIHHLARVCVADECNKERECRIPNRFLGHRIIRSRLDGQGTQPRDSAVHLDLAHNEVDVALLGGGTETSPRRAKLGDANRRFDGA